MEDLSNPQKSNESEAFNKIIISDSKSNDSDNKKHRPHIRLPHKEAVRRESPSAQESAFYSVLFSSSLSRILSLNLFSFRYIFQIFYHAPEFFRNLICCHTHRCFQTPGTGSCLIIPALIIQYLHGLLQFFHLTVQFFLLLSE